MVKTKTLSTKNTIRIYKYSFLALIAYLLFFIPNITIAKYYWDDFTISISLPSLKNYYDFDYFDISWNFFLYFFGLGRFYGLYLTHYLVFYFTDNPLQYQFVKAVFNLIPLYLFAHIINLLTKNKNNSWFFIFVMPITFFSIIYIDSLTTQGLSIQISAIYLALSTIFFIKTKESPKIKYKILSYFFFFMSFFHYEIGLMSVFLNSIIALKYKNYFDEKTQQDSGFFNKIYGFDYLKSMILVNLKELKYYNLMIVIWLLIYFINYKVKTEIYTGINFNFQISAIFLTWLYQIICSLPFGAFDSNFYGIKSDLFQTITGSIIFLIFYFLIKKFLKKITINLRDSKILTHLGLSLILIPPLILSCSKFYQNIILSKPSPNCFIQVYFQYIGVGLIILVFCAKIIDNSKKFRSALTTKILINFSAFFLALIITLVHLVNYETFKKKNLLNYNAQMLEKAFKKGIDAGVSKNIYTKNLAEIVKKNEQSNYAKFLVFNRKKQINEINPKYQDENILLSNIDFIHGSLFFQKLSNSYYEVFKINSKESIEYRLEKGIDFNNHYFIDDGFLNSKITKFVSKNNVSGFVIFGKLVNILIDQESNEIKYVLNSPKIFIDKNYVFKLEEILKILDKKLESKNFVKNFDKYRNNINTSDDGIIIELNGIYNYESKDLYCVIY